MAASSVHAGSRFYYTVVVVSMKPGHMLSTGYSVESLYPGMINQDTFKAPAMASYYFPALFLLSPLYAPLHISSQICISVYIAFAFLPLCFCLSHSSHLTGLSFLANTHSLPSTKQQITFPSSLSIKSP